MKIYYLPDRITKSTIYYKMLPELTEMYRNIKSGDQVNLSMEAVNEIDSNALLLFTGMLILLRRKTGNPVWLELRYNPRLISFLMSAGFFENISRYQIAEYEEGYLADEANYSFKLDNKLSMYSPIKNYEEMDELKKQEIRDEVAQELRRNIIYSSIMKKVSQSDQMLDIVATTFAEIGCNSIVHSKSISCIYMQPDIKFEDGKTGYLLSAMDAGIGFYTSLMEKAMRRQSYSLEERIGFYEYSRKLGIDIRTEINFLSIMEALYYSQTKSRDMDFFKLKNMLALSNANLRIHQKNKEIVFTAKRCRNCKKRDILACTSCVWNNRNVTIKTYPVALAGVHIEVEFIKET